jgi:hypothetical protein
LSLNPIQKNSNQQHPVKPTTTLAAALLCALSPLCFAKPLKVFILAGQSNMEGHAAISTFDYIGKDPRTAPLLKAMRHTAWNPVGGGEDARILRTASTCVKQDQLGKE